MNIKNLVAYSTVFLSGACIMIVELAAGRLISRYLGQSLYTWTSVIGVILAGISVGNYLGGRLADTRGAAVRKIAAVFVCASLACLLIPVLNNRVADWNMMWRLAWPTRIFLHVLCAFFVPSILLGMIGPVVAKWVLSDSVKLGSSVGNLYAWNTAGSIAGTFLAGYYLIAWVGASRIILVVAALLAVAGLAFAARAFWTRAWAVVCLVLVGLGVGPGVTLASWGTAIGLREQDSEDTVYRDESEYSYIRVTADREDPTQRAMYLDKLKHSDFDTAHPLNLCYDYHWVYEAVINHTTSSNQPVAALVLGGGAYAFPRWVEAARPGSRVEVCEIDPAVTRAAYAACGLASNTTIKTFNVDARVFVADLCRPAATGVPRPRYDFILGDFLSDYSIPYQMTSVEFVSMIASLMTEDGVYMLNLIDCYYPGNFLGSMLRTLEHVFPSVSVFSCNPSLEERDTFVIVCSKKKRAWNGLVDRIKEERPYGGRQLDDETITALLHNPMAQVLTDDCAPVENLLAPTVRKDKSGMIAWHFDLGVRAAQNGDFEEAARQFKALLELYPRDEYAYNYLGQSLERLDNPADALDAYAAALQFKPRFVEAKNNAAMLLARMGKMDAAIQQWREVLAINPLLNETHDNLGTALARTGDIKGAIEHWNQALMNDPGDPVALENVGGASMSRGDLATAILYYEKALPRSATPELVHQQLARIYTALGDPTRAAEHAAKGAVR